LFLPKSNVKITVITLTPVVNRAKHRANIARIRRNSIARIAFMLAFGASTRIMTNNFMDYESSPERLSTNPTHKRTGKNLPKETQEKVQEMLKDGSGASEINQVTGVNRTTVIAMRQNMESNSEFQLGTWKKQTATLMSQIVSRGSTRLLEEIENIPAGQLPLAIAIMTDKVLALQDAPTVIVEHRLRVSHEDINAMLKGDIIDLPPAKESP
jgi:hypothetical protein